MTVSANGFDAVTFDYWHTLVRAPDVEETKGRRAEWVAAVLRRFELEVADVRLREAIDAVARAAHDNWVANRQYYAPEASSELLRLLDIEAEAELLDAVIESFNAGGDGAPVVELTPNIESSLAALRSEGLRVGIVCDVGMTPSTMLRRHLDRHGVLKYFDHWSFSDEVGCFKPAREIFDHALRGLGVDDPAGAVHVGDLRRTDVAGAQAMGMTAVRYAGSNDDDGGPDDPEADHVITDHAELPAVLGLS